jgi:hypothetical protein
MGWDGVSGVVVVARCWTGPCFRSPTELFRDLSRQPAAPMRDRVRVQEAVSNNNNDNNTTQTKQ